VFTPERVVVTRAPGAGYGPCAAVAAPELPAGHLDDLGGVAVRRLLEDAGLDAARRGTPEWNPLGEFIPPGGRVVVKPNWVHHHNHSGAGLDVLVTHTSVVEAVARYAGLARPSSLVIGDAPIQGCDFGALRAAAGLGEMEARLREAGVPVQVRDFRRTVLPGGRIGAPSLDTARRDEDYVLFDLGEASALEPVTRPGAEFRVTKYDPERLRRTHGPGRHQYLVAREVIEADVVISVPKLKTHKKAGITGALKNLVGINGLKDYLPHHRKGGPAAGGDCYPERSALKALAEDLLDHANRPRGGTGARVLAGAARAAMAGGTLLGHSPDLEGSWHGNDTVWRMCLDLQRLLRYGRPDGTLASTPQRTVLTVTDAIVAGEGDGPLHPLPVPLGVLTFAASPPAAERVHAFLMGFDPARVPLLRHAFDPEWGLVDFGPEAVRAELDGEAVPDLPSLAALSPRAFVPPRGWRGHVELAPTAAGRE